MHSLYRYFSATDQLLYIGISHNPFHREMQHRAGVKDMKQVCLIEIEWFDTAANAEQAERIAIKRERPLWNVKWQREARRLRATQAPKLARQLRKPMPIPKPRPKVYSNMGPHLPPVQGPLRPYKVYGIGDVTGSDVDFAFGRDEIERAFKVARRGDKIIFGHDIKATGEQIRALIERQVYHA